MGKTKADAAKVLIETGWTWNEVKAVLDDSSSTWVPYPVYPGYPWWQTGSYTDTSDTYTFSDNVTSENKKVTDPENTE